VIEAALVALTLAPVPPILQQKQIKAGGAPSYGVGLLVGSGHREPIESWSCRSPGSPRRQGLQFGRQFTPARRTVADEAPFNDQAPLHPA
jgi:hypothetical protein